MGKRVLIGPSVYYPTPGTNLFKKCKEVGILPSHSSQWRSSALPIETKEFNCLDIVTLLRLARTINFMKRKIDKRELNEGITWKEFSQIMKDKAKVKAETENKVKVEDEVKFYSTCNKSELITWVDLLLLLFNKRSFFGIRKDFGKRTSFFKEKSSKKVLDYFFEKAWEEPILRSRND
jgi:hypothetical protein